MPPVGDNLTSRAVAVLLGVFGLFAVLVIVLVSWPSPGGAPGGLFQLPLPHEAQTIVQAVEASAPAVRPLVLKALNGSVTSVRVQPAFPPAMSELHRAPELEWAFRSYAGELGARPFRVELKRGGVAPLGLLLHRPDAQPAVRLAVALKTGGVLVLEHRPPALARAYIARFAAGGAAVALMLLLSLAWTVRETTRPVRRLAEAARRFPLDQAAPALPLSGPREVRELSAAFNDMQAQIRDLVADRTRLLAAIAHDLRTYLTRLRLRVDFIDDPDQRQRAERDIEEMARLLDDTLLFAQHSTRAELAVDGCDARREIEALVAERQEVGDPVETGGFEGLDEGPVPLACAPRSLRRILGNLIDNAIRYGVKAHVRAKVSGAELLIEVEDEGGGVAENVLQDLTKPFLRLDESRTRDAGGSGLGLAIVKGLAEGCGGSLLLENGAARGLRAVVRLPISNGEPGAHS